MTKRGKNLTDLLDLNRSQILYYLAQHKGCSRAELGEATGLTLASITKIVRPLVESNVIYETGYAEGKKGRRSVGLSINYQEFKILAIRISWSRMEIRVFDFLGNTYGDAITFPYEAITIHNIESITNTLIDSILEFQKKFPELKAIGIATLGPYYRETGNLLLPPYHKDPDNRNYFSIKEKITAKISLPVFIEHDACVGALAYWWFHTKYDPSLTILHILTGEGVGGGLVNAGHIFTGTNNCSSEIGHITIDYNGRKCTCGSNGCMNAYCTTNAMQEMATEQLPNFPNSILQKKDSITIENIFDAASKKDPFATQLIYNEGTYLGHGLLSLLHVFDPNIIVISGPMTQGKEILQKGIEDTFEKRQASFTRLPEIKLYDLEMDLTLLGAATFAMDCMLQKPTQYMVVPLEKN